MAMVSTIHGNGKYLLRGGNALYDALDIFHQMLVCLSVVIEELVMREVRGIRSLV